ncbi:MAG: nitrate transporter [Hyphomicrobiales bacterium]|nr:nitrate transporter [Hyphomicrobiales bacterium]
MIDIRIGYLPLTDAASLIAAADFGFAEKEGLRIELQRDVSWANLRDKLIVGHIEAAHMLAPLAVATTLGLGQLRTALRAIFVLSANGNAITLSNALAAEVAAVRPGALDSYTETALALGGVVARRRAEGLRPLTFAAVFPFSSHTYLLRRFLALGGVDSTIGVEIVVVPPPYMVDCIDKGLIDGFCVGSPWNSLAVDQGRGVIVALGSELMPDAVEKVLAVQAGSSLMTGPAGPKLVRALDAASRFVADPEQRLRLSEALARPERFDMSAEVIGRTLSGDLILDADGRTRHAARFIRFAGEGLNRPDPATGSLVYGEMVAAGQVKPGAEGAQTAAQVFTREVYDRSFA